MNTGAYVSDLVLTPAHPNEDNALGKELADRFGPGRNARPKALEVGSDMGKIRILSKC